MATYRVGTGLAGEVEVGALSSMQNKPFGVASVTNPLQAAGAAPPDTSDTARTKAPLVASVLERIVSLQDFADFALTFAGIGKVQVAQLQGNQTQVVHLTVLGADQQEVQTGSELYTSLVNGINAIRFPHRAVVVQSGSSLMLRFNVEATIWVEPRYQLAPVQTAIETTLKQAYDFAKRSFGQDVAASDVITQMQQVRGVHAVELHALYIASEARVNNPLLRAQMARWDAGKSAFEPAQLLVINATDQDGIKLTMEHAHE